MSGRNRLPGRSFHAAFLAAGVLCVAPGHAQPPPGSYTGTTQQGEDIEVTVGAAGTITSYTVTYRCPFFTAQKTVNTSCPIAPSGTFSCGTTFCAPFQSTTRISGSFSGSSVSGTLVVGDQPDVLSSCCQLSLAFDAGGGGGGGGSVPAAPSALTATALSASRIDLAWLDNASDEDDVRLERRTTGGFAEVATLAAGATGFSDTGLAPDTAYRYRVRACNSAGCSPYSNEATATTFAAAGGCTADDTTSCLLDGRFRIEVTWRDFQDQTGPGHAVPLSDKSVLFWFFSADNIEMLFKMVDACGVPGFDSFWVFFAATTNVEFAVTVVDTETGASRTYDNLLGHAADAITDTSAFATCP